MGEDVGQASTFPRLFAEIVAARADHPALIVADETLTYAELDRRSSRMARALLASGAGKGTRIGLLAPDGPLLLTTFYAALRIGALVTPISTLTTPPELAHILRNSDIQILVGVRRFLRRDFSENLTAAFPELSEGSADALRLLAAPHLRSIWLDDSVGLPWARPIGELLDRADSPTAPDAALLAAIEDEVSPGDDAFVVYTSGTTALPKAVVHGQWSVARQPRALAPVFLMTEDDRTMSLLPAFWLGGIAAALQVLSTGSTLVYPSSPEIDDVLDMVERYDITYIVVWHMLAKLRSAAIERGIDADKIRGMGAPHRDEHGELIPAGLRANLLGMSESFAPHSAELINHRMPDGKQGSSGRAVNGIERRVVDPDTGIEVAAGEVGELQLRGGALMTGLYKVDRREVFTPDGFYSTKDLVRIDEDGYAWFVGRTGDMIKTSSANVSRLEVEAALNSLADVDLSVVAGVPDAELGEMVVAAVVPAPDTSPTVESLQAQLREKISGFKIPRRVVFIDHDDIPRTSTGKIRLVDLADMITTRLDAVGEPTPRSVLLQVDTSEEKLMPKDDKKSKDDAPKNGKKAKKDKRKKGSGPSAEEIVLYEKDPATKIATITLDRADDLNAMTIEAQHRYADLIHQANIDDDVKVLVIRANGPNLGSGADLPELMDIMAGRGDLEIRDIVRVPEDADVEYPPGGTYRYGASNVQFYTDPAAGMRSLQDFKKISILEVRGYCYGWHFYQAADADLVISSDDALFGHAAFRYAGFAARQWQWCSMMGVRKFMEMVFTGRPFTATEMYEIDFVNAVVPFDELEAMTEKYALACSRSGPTDTVFAQKTFFNIFKQYQGEYMGSILSGLLESTGRQLKPDPTDFQLNKDVLDRGLTNSVRDNDENFPPEWRLSHRGRNAGQTSHQSQTDNQ